MFCGIDEAGRGPIAGPLCVAGVVLVDSIEGLNDSKKLSEKKREMLFKKIVTNSIYHIVLTPAKDIDKFGISACIKNSIIEIMKNIDAKRYLMDGNTTFAIENLEKEIKADAKYDEVSAASILAKVTRDRYMVNISKDFPNYNFDKHKGYGTKAHIEAVQEFGRCDEHRYTFNTKGIDY